MLLRCLTSMGSLPVRGVAKCPAAANPGLVTASALLRALEAAFCWRSHSSSPTSSSESASPSSAYDANDWLFVSDMVGGGSGRRCD